MKKSIIFIFEKETKGTIRFTETSDEPVVGTLYIKKSALEGQIPKKVNIIIETTED